ncbi:YbaB/EbfC family nucleoid-associated protein [Amycolatopsis sp. NBC_00345]|uniref:YbaB/EbfC family nucleoid-associated protein n=1 Tax=Amycolatopsis sp. NBC_00345 TaxID=2975955 RepID=UPI002E2563AF
MDQIDDLTRLITGAQDGLRTLIERSKQEGQQAGEVKSALTGLTGRAVSKDGGITVTVDSSGVPTALELSPAVGRLGPHQLAGEIMTCLRHAQAALAKTAEEQFRGNPLGERFAHGLAGRFPPPAAEPVTGPQEVPIGQLHAEAAAPIHTKAAAPIHTKATAPVQAAATAPPPAPVRTPRPVRAPEPEEPDDDFADRGVFQNPDRREHRRG